MFNVSFTTVPINSISSWKSTVANNLTHLLDNNSGPQRICMLSYLCTHYAFTSSASQTCQLLEKGIYIQFKRFTKKDLHFLTTSSTGMRTLMKLQTRKYNCSDSLSSDLKSKSWLTVSELRAFFYQNVPAVNTLKENPHPDKQGNMRPIVTLSWFSFQPSPLLNILNLKYWTLRSPSIVIHRSTGSPKMGERRINSPPEVAITDQQATSKVPARRTSHPYVSTQAKQPDTKTLDY